MNETIEYRGFDINISVDECPLNPLVDWDNASTMVCQHGRYSLGNEKHGVDLSECNNWDDVKQAIIDQKNPLAILPLYLYDHSGITINTTGFSCNFDSGQVGFIFIDQAGCDLVGYDEDWLKTGYNGKTGTEALEEVMRSDVEIYDNYISGQVYSFEVCDESCGGFFGYDHEKSGLLDHAKSLVDCEISLRIKNRIEKLKGFIKAGVPIIYRTFPEIS